MDMRPVSSLTTTVTASLSSLNPSAAQAGQEVELRGYSGLMASGGSAAGYGGVGGSVIIKAMASSRGSAFSNPFVLSVIWNCRKA